MGYAIEHFVDIVAAEEQMAEGVCPCCRCLWRQPVKMNGCSHVFCTKCITAWAICGKRTCPCCRTGFRVGQHRSWMPMTTEMMPPGLTALKMNCVNGCGVMSTVATFDVHHTLRCPLRQQKFIEFYHQLLQEKNLPLDFHSPYYKFKARRLYDGLPE